MGRQWTNEQKSAIEARNGSVLVSAAAGSGKTSVLVERVIRRICDPACPCDADRLLIVTFTRAAAGEMHERISAAINDGLRASPDDKNLRRQQIILANAKICTIDSFCSSLVRENFEKLDISPDFKTIDSAEQTVLMTQAAETVLERMYSEGGEDFNMLAGLLYSGRNDDQLVSALYRLYGASLAHPFPDEWLDSLADAFSDGKPVEQTYQGRLVLGYIADAMDYCKTILAGMRALTSTDEQLDKSFDKCISSDLSQVVHIRDAAENGDWDSVYCAVNDFNFVTKGRVPKEYKNSDIDIALTDKRKTLKEKIIKKLPEVISCSSEAYTSDMQALSPAAHALVRAVKLFSGEFGRLKAERNAVDFADIELMALSLLVEKTDDGYRKTELARELSENFEEILIDEYQDTNEAQDMLFTALSRDGRNLFRVGDVKQSIYRFRQAMPEIFLNLRSSYSDYDGSTYPARINLSSNFRSRSGVTGSVNYVFSQLMSKSCGELDYDENEELNACAAYEPADGADVKLHVLNLGDDDSGMTKDELQADYVARLTEDILGSGLKVKDKEGMRPVRRGDICVLMRSMAGRGATYADAFRRRGIAAFTQTSTEFFGATEVSTVLSLLRVIDNPRQDIPLLAVMLSPIFGFTPDEAALLRTDAQGDCLYTRAVCLSGKGNKKYSVFINSLSHMRLISATLCTNELLRRLYDETGYFAAVQAMPEGARRRANLLLLIDYAATYEASGYIGLTGFIRFIDKLDSDKKTLSGTAAVSESADVVRIMTIHESKGLEFPVCIIANCSGQFNRDDENGSFVLDSGHGMGFKLRNINTLAQYDTLSRSAAKLSMRRAAMSEEMRILYVAMTRAKEKLIMVSGLRKPEATLSALAQDIVPGRVAVPSFPVSSAKSYSDWLLTALMRHPDCGQLRKLAGANDDIVLPSDFSVDFCYSTPQHSSAAPAETVADDCQADESILGMIKDKLSYVYRYSALHGIATKRTASGINSEKLNREYFATSRPAFMSADGLTPAQRGTATHKFMQFCDYRAAEKDTDAEKERLVCSGHLTRAEADSVKTKQIAAFFSGRLYERIRQSGAVYREKSFMIEVPLRELYDGIPDYITDSQLIQGVCDCAFVENDGLVIVDYKTDSVSCGEELRERYSEQLRVYARAMEECLGLPVKQLLLWSFCLGSEVECRRNK